MVDLMRRLLVATIVLMGLPAACDTGPATTSAEPVSTPVACAPDDQEAWQQTIVPWLSSVLTSAGAPEGWDVSPADIHDTQSALRISLPEYEERGLDVYVHAGVPDMEHDPRPSMDSYGPLHGYDVYYAQNNQATLQQYLAASPRLWIMLYVYTDEPGRAVSENEYKSWFERVIASLEGNPPPVC